MYKIGDRVGAVIDVNNGVVRLLGFGIYRGDEIPPSNVGGFNFGWENPKIVLDNGDVIWGCECWWDQEDKIKEMLNRAITVISVSIDDFRPKNPNKEGGGDE